MHAEALRELLGRKPFEPFTIRMTNGDVFPVKHPEMALQLKTKIIVSDPDNDRSWICSLLHIATIEAAQPA